MATSRSRSDDSASRAPGQKARDWPGKRLGLPEKGGRSIARAGRRIAGIAIDWGLALLISFAFFHYDAFATLATFAVMQIALIATAGGSAGQLLLGMRVVPLASGRVGVWRPAVRTILLCLFIPAVIWNRDQRGLHDLLAGTVLVRS